MLSFDVITLFPEMFETGPLNDSMIQIAQDKKIIRILAHDLRGYTHDKHRTVDDTPYGGGPGMVMKPEPLFEAITAIKKKRKHARVVLMTPKGSPFDQKTAKRFTNEKELILVCGHYEGIDQRVHEALIDEEISIGDYVLTGGELPAMCVIDAVTRLLPGVLGNEESIQHESFQTNMLDHPHYTRPQEYQGMKVPEVLLSGNHGEIASWRKKEALKLTKKRRPDLLE